VFRAVVGQDGERCLEGRDDVHDSWPPSVPVTTRRFIVPGGRLLWCPRWIQR